MQETFPNPEPAASKSKVSPVTIAIAAMAILAVVATLWFLLEPLETPKVRPTTQTVNLKMSDAEKAYLRNIEIGDLALSRAENFLRQEVTILNGEIYNGGTETVSGLRLTTEFSDDMNQVILRETRAILGTPELPLTPGERRAFEISFDHVPNSWNMQKPAVHVEYLQLPQRK